MRSDPSLREAIGALLEDPLDRILARSILGTDDADAIASQVTDFVARQLGRAIVGCPLFIQSVGAVFGLDLDDGTRVAMKIHAFGELTGRARARSRTQRPRSGSAAERVPRERAAPGISGRAT